MRRIALYLIFAFISFNTQAEVQSGRINSLLSLSEKYRHDGANCFASVVFASGLIDDASYISSEFFEALTATPYCKKISSDRPLKSGDFIVIGESKHNEGGRWIHTVLALDGGNGFAKMGYKKDDKTVVTDLQKNVLWYLQQDPSMKTNQFNCDFKGLRMMIEHSDLAASWDELLLIRKQLFAELTLEVLPKHDVVVQKLDRLEAEISKSKAHKQLLEIVRSLLASTRDQLQLMDAFIVEI